MNITVKAKYKGRRFNYNQYKITMFVDGDFKSLEVCSKDNKKEFEPKEILKAIIQDYKIYQLMKDEKVMATPIAQNTMNAYKESYKLIKGIIRSGNTTLEELERYCNEGV